MKNKNYQPTNKRGRSIVSFNILSCCRDFTKYNICDRFKIPFDPSEAVVAKITRTFLSIEYF